MRRSRSRGRVGDHLVVDDRSGFTCWASETQREWNGALVHKRRWEARHPQDLVRGVPDRLRVEPSRPTPAPADLPSYGSRTTAMALAGSAGDDIVVVESITGIGVGDWLRIFLDNGDVFQTRATVVPLTIDSLEPPIDASFPPIDATQTILISPPLPWPAAVGNLVVDISNTTAPTL